jgi:hypothetical protein
MVNGPSELKKKLKGDQTGRTDRFTKLLIGLRLRLKGPVPYAFKTPDGAVRSLDAGCLGFLHHSKSQQISFTCNVEGKITHVDLVDGAFASLEPIYGKLEKAVTPINSWRTLYQAEKQNGNHRDEAYYLKNAVPNEVGYWVFLVRHAQSSLISNNALINQSCGYVKNGQLEHSCPHRLGSAPWYSLQLYPVLHPQLTKPASHHRSEKPSKVAPFRLVVCAHGSSSGTWMREKQGRCHCDPVGRSVGPYVCHFPLWRLSGFLCPGPT